MHGILGLSRKDGSACCHCLVLHAMFELSYCLYYVWVLFSKCLFFVSWSMKTIHEFALSSVTMICNIFGHNDLVDKILILASK